MQGSLSQISDLGPSFHFMKSRKLHCKKKDKKLPIFCHKMKTRALIKKIENASLKKNLKVRQHRSMGD